jgi:hypothetical protein
MVCTFIHQVKAEEKSAEQMCEENPRNILYMSVQVPLGFPLVYISVADPHHVVRFRFRYGKRKRFLRFWFRNTAIFISHLNGKVLEVGILCAALGPEALVHQLGVGALLLLELELQLLPAPLLEEARHHAEVGARHRQRPVETERLLSGGD